MKQAVLIPWDLIVALVQGENTKFYTWLNDVDAPIVLFPKRPDNMVIDRYQSIFKCVQLAIHASENKPTLKDEGFVHHPDFEINVDLEHVVELLADLEERRRNCLFGFCLQGEVSKLQRFKRVVVEPYYEKLKEYLKPFADPDKNVDLNKNILRVERNRYIAASVINQYELALVRKPA